MPSQVKKCAIEPHQSYIALKLTSLFGCGNANFRELRNVTVGDIKFHDVVCASDISKKFKTCKISGFDQVFRVASDSFQVKLREDIMRQLRNYCVQGNELHVVLNLNADRTQALARLTEVESSEGYELPDQSLYSLSGSTHVIGLSLLGFDTTSHKGLLGAMLSGEARRRIPYLTGALSLYVDYHSCIGSLAYLKVSIFMGVVEPPVAQLLIDLVMYNRELRNVAESNVLPHAQSERLLSILDTYYDIACKYVGLLDVLAKVEDITPDFLSSLIVASCRKHAVLIDGDAPLIEDDIVCANIGAVRDDGYYETILTLLIDRDYRSFHLHQVLEKVCEEARVHGRGVAGISARYDRLSMGLPGILEVAYVLANSFYSDLEQVSDYSYVEQVSEVVPRGKFRIGFKDSVVTISGYDSSRGDAEAYADILVDNPQAIKTKVSYLMKNKPKFMLPWAYVQVLLNEEPNAKQKFPSILGAGRAGQCSKVVFDAEFKERKEYLKSLARSNDGQVVIKKAVSFMIYEDLRALFKGRKNVYEIFEKYKRSDGMEHFGKFYGRTRTQISTQFICKDYIPIGSALELPKVEMVAICHRHINWLQIIDVTQNSNLPEMSSRIEHVKHAHAL